MSIKALIVSVLFVCSLLPGFILAHNKVVVVPLTETQANKPTARTYEIISYGQYPYYNRAVNMIRVNEGECFLHWVDAWSWSVGSSTTTVRNICQIFSIEGYWRLTAYAPDNHTTTCKARCLIW